MAGIEMDTGAGEPEKVAVEIVAADGVARTEEVHVEDVVVLEPGEMVKTPEGQPDIEAPAAVEIEPDVEAIAEAAAEKAVEKAGIASTETLDPPTVEVQESADPGGRAETHRCGARDTLLPTRKQRTRKLVLPPSTLTWLAPSRPSLPRSMTKTLL